MKEKFYYSQVQHENAESKCSLLRILFSYSKHDIKRVKCNKKIQCNHFSNIKKIPCLWLPAKVRILYSENANMRDDPEWAGRMGNHRHE